MRILGTWNCYHGFGGQDPKGQSPSFSAWQQSRRGRSQIQSSPFILHKLNTRATPGRPNLRTAPERVYGSSVGFRPVASRYSLKLLPDSFKGHQEPQSDQQDSGRQLTLQRIFLAPPKYQKSGPLYGSSILTSRSLGGGYRDGGRLAPWPTQRVQVSKYQGRR